MRIYLNKNALIKHAPAAFLDRDGTINRNIKGKYINKPEQFDFYNGTFEALELLSKKGYNIVVLSNHSGIGRGYMTLETAEKINLKMVNMLARKNINLSGIYICPHLPDADCACRKPKDGLLKEALADMDIDTENSFVAGDSSGDLKLAENVKIPGYLVLTGAGTHTVKKYPNALKYKNLLSLAKQIKEAKH